ncbi:hypothetical protein RN001_012914 [Aquatica leii]|uniref:HTH psq-type domain-containing protein n=1 Tax=Aquatica leii TaxID=1421715 RepID=A0AAN7SDI3_9COLE|nr:hypothetical protein RN001_012914 [Aquatica leii]
MKRAIEQILSDAMGYKKAAQTYMVSQSTLEDKMKKMKKNGLSLEDAFSKVNCDVFNQCAFKSVVFLVPLQEIVNIETGQICS